MAENNMNPVKLGCILCAFTINAIWLYIIIFKDYGPSGPSDEMFFYVGWIRTISYFVLAAQLPAVLNNRTFAHKAALSLFIINPVLCAVFNSFSEVTGLSVDVALLNQIMITVTPVAATMLISYVLPLLERIDEELENA